MSSVSDRVSRAVLTSVLRAARRLDRAAERALVGGPRALAPLLLGRGAPAASASAAASAALRSAPPSVDGALGLLVELNYAASLLEDTPGSPRAGVSTSSVRVGDTVLVGGGRALVVGRAPRGGLLVLDDDEPRVLAAARAAAARAPRAPSADADAEEEGDDAPVAAPRAAAALPPPLAAAAAPPPPPRSVPAAAVTRLPPTLILHAALPLYATAFTAGPGGGWALTREVEALYVEDAYAARPLPARVAARVAATAAARAHAAAAEGAAERLSPGAARAARAGARV